MGVTQSLEQYRLCCSNAGTDIEAEARDEVAVTPRVNESQVSMDEWLDKMETQDPKWMTKKKIKERIVQAREKFAKHKG